MTHHYISFANSTSDLPTLKRFYQDSAGCRATLQLLSTSHSDTSFVQKLWVDACVDGLHSPKINDPQDKTNSSFKEYIGQFDNYRSIAEASFQRSPDKLKVRSFVNAVLAKASTFSPDGWISVPQLPYSLSSSRNKINRMLAEASAEWRSASRYRGKLILPVIFAKSGMTDRKTDRNPKVELAFDCFDASDASGVWVVDSTLDDQAGVGNFDSKRFPGIINFHDELNERLPPETVTVAGPYWGLNIVLWARGLARFIAIGPGRSYRYYVPGGRLVEGSPRVALTPLRRLAVWSPELKLWLEETVRRLSKSDPAQKEFLLLLKEFAQLGSKDFARQQVARFYKSWLEKFERISPNSRALTLYQDLSAAYVLGMSLKPLPDTEIMRDPARVAKQFMVNCL